MDNPEEEDPAIANLSPCSYLHMYSFPRVAAGGPGEEASLAAVRPL